VSAGLGSADSVLAPQFAFSIKTDPVLQHTLPQDPLPLRAPSSLIFLSFDSSPACLVRHVDRCKSDNSPSALSTRYWFSGPSPLTVFYSTFLLLYKKSEERYPAARFSPKGLGIGRYLSSFGSLYQLALFLCFFFFPLIPWINYLIPFHESASYQLPVRQCFAVSSFFLPFHFPSSFPHLRNDFFFPILEFGLNMCNFAFPNNPLKHPYSPREPLQLHLYLRPLFRIVTFFQ